MSRPRKWSSEAVRVLVLALAMLTVGRSAFAADFVVPQLTGAVVDGAGMLTQNQAAVIAQLLTGLWRDGGSQIALLTVPDLGGSSIEEVSIRVTDAWKLGDKQKDNGVLLIISKADRKIRIEVGQGLEGALPDAYAKRIIDDTMRPLFQSGQVNQGLLRGLIEIIHHTDPDVDVTKYLGGTRRQAVRQDDGFSNVVFLILLLILVPISFFLRLLGFGRHRSGWYGGGFGGGGGGGFSGGGGGFSGGGASGGW